MRSIKAIIILGLALVVAGCGSFAAPKEKITLYKSYTCGCCKGWKEHMARYGYQVHVVNMEDKDMSAIKKKYAIPTTVKSCHTAITADYIVEGHVPARVVDNLLDVRPEIDGIAMAGMPAGSPGMPGRKNGTWRIYSMKNGKVDLYEKL